MSEFHVHPIPPLYDAQSRVLILGSFPSVKSREAAFFYGHPQNRFWRVISLLLGCAVPKTTEEKAAIAAYAASLVSALSAHLAEEDTIAISGFGQFEVKRKMERIIINPSSKQRMLVPPKIVVGFKPGATLKERINQKKVKE